MSNFGPRAWGLAPDRLGRLYGSLAFRASFQVGFDCPDCFLVDDALERRHLYRAVANHPLHRLFHEKLVGIGQEIVISQIGCESSRYRLETVATGAILNVSRSTNFDRLFASAVRILFAQLFA